ncbi:bifunctional 4-hydroxy-2-oxoglutarate aldolase/2-dehydro-3-deoxy-phosphogluconate aldolase [Aggregatilinea lenta]|uniref:bifunctional 4-hydroxy-2-oxoglutarate aldolase/2-dehydro-3-deoxy-phosphogluconate aldolase n=1 Tax=Aggregatilinea lenta TaxID=913108 RepID=UPI000E5AEFD5|nr:bifunctional 4-hydroxy-2-oxoglutarate aldolase/2-dehydro-3-deoxy-phosphogluconate aldolase [Aggregatilinea lenta]
MARFDRLSVLNTVIAGGMVPLFYNADVDTARQIAAALYKGGARVLEFTNRGDFAIEVFSALVKHCAQAQPELIVGVGSVDDAPTAALYMAHGANFVVGPTFNEEVVRVCNRHKVAYMPGCGSVNDIARAEEWGVEIVKAFPGTAVGGPGFVKDLLGPRPWSRLMPTGGVTTEEANLRAWFDAGVACVGMGSNLVKKDWVKAGDFQSIEHATRGALDLIRVIRGL